MKKFSALIVLVVLAALAVAPLALAKGPAEGGKSKGKAKFELNAVVVSTDVAANTITVKVTSGNKAVKAYRGKEITLSIAADAKIQDATGEKCASTTLSAFVAGAKVHIGGTVQAKKDSPVVFVAKKLILKALPAAETAQ